MSVQINRPQSRPHIRVDWPLLLAFAAVLLVLATFPPSFAVSAIATAALSIAGVAEYRKRR